MEERREVELPQLPDPKFDYEMDDGWRMPTDAFTADQMRAYGQLCARMAREQEREIWGTPSWEELISALAQCRDAFPMPERGSDADDAWVQAIGDPLSVPAFVRAALASYPADSPPRSTTTPAETPSGS